ncbi:MAG: AzlC family ABC transporter permease [Eubacterium sp.]|nr:AzlC family ABC transporter permease [Eubacterium sp.]
MKFKQGIRDGIPIGLGYVAVSFAFGILAVDKDLSVAQSVLISAANVTSAGQFAGLTIMASTGSLIEMALSQFIINLRYMLMSISLSQKVDEDFKGIWRWILGFAVTDEIFAVAIQSPGKVKRNYFAGLIILPILGWVTGTLGGALLGNVLPAALSSALGVALYGMFIAVVIPKAREDGHVFIAVLIAIAISVALKYIPFFSGLSDGFAIIICTLAASVMAAILFPVEVEEDEF